MKNFSFFYLCLITIVFGCSDSPYMQGKRLYTTNCQNCHMEDGSGLANLIPALNTSKLLGTSNIACVLKKGINDTIRRDSTFLLKQMPSFSKLSATEMTNIVNYVNHKWFPAFKEQTILDIELVLKNCN